MHKVKRIKLDNDGSDTKTERSSRLGAMRAILDDDLEADTPLMDIYTALIKNRRDISTVIVAINTVLPFSEYSHLKRVRGREIFLCPVAYASSRDELIAVLKTNNFNVDLIESEIGIVQAARVAPKVRKQYEKVHEMWPCNFHANKYLETLATDCLFSMAEVEGHADFMRVAMDVRKESKIMKISTKNVGAVVVDPKLNSIVALGYDLTHLGPCRHAVMVAMDNVAKTQGGGAWNSPENSNSVFSERDLVEKLQESHRGVKFGASCDENEPSSYGPYLCTGFYLYITHEPCAMCAMALVHSRIKRVFYSRASAKGALGTLCKIHTVKELNHHYEVFAGLLESEL